MVKEFRHFILFLLGAITLSKCALVGEQSQSWLPPAGKPNILYVLADQWRASATGYAGDPNVKTPTLDRLAKESLSFRNAVSVLPVCTPHRAALMTGRFPTSTGMFLNDAHLPDSELCMAEILSAAGYTTAYIGKWHLDGQGREGYIPPERRQGWNYWKAAECDHNYTNSHYYTGTSDVKRHWDGYDAFAQTKDAQQYLRDHSRAGQPFVLMVAYGVPHFPHATAQAEYKALYPPDQIKLSPNVPPELGTRARREAQGYYAHCTALDKCIGDLLGTLAEIGLATNTIFVFSSDHGEMLGSQGVAPKQKQVAWNESAQVPLLVRVPGLGGRTVKTPITTPDILPTLLGLAGVKSPDSIEGEDLSSSIRSGRDEDRAALYMAVSPFTSGVSPDKSKEYRAIRTSRYTYVRSLQGSWMLFDEEKDPNQMNNLVSEPEHGALVRELDDRLQAHLRRIGDDFGPGKEYIAEWGYEVGAHGSIPYAARSTKVQTPRRDSVAKPALQTPKSAADFYAYYTSLDYIQPPPPEMLGKIPVNAARTFAGGKPDKTDEAVRPPRPGQVRWGKYADLVVNVAEGRQLVFSRATGYLPYLQTAKGKFLLKSLAECREDPLCLSSYVRLVEDRPGRMVVHWRHVPDPSSVVMTEEIHEYFIVTPNAEVRREVRVGTERLDDFNDPGNVTVQALALSAEGITELSLTQPRHSSQPARPVAGSPLRKAEVGSPASWLKFDDGLFPSRDETTEAVKNTFCRVAGNKTLWKKGVSGTALAFDGYFSKVTLPKDKAPVVQDELTLEAWVALGAYPWNDAGIVHQSAGEAISPEDYKHGYRDPYVYRPWKMEGYLLGIDPYGRPIFKVNGQQIGGGLLEHKDTVTKEDALPTYRWTHLAATYGRGQLCLYVNGRLCTSNAATGPIAVPDRDVLIGLNGDAQRISDPVSHSKFAANNNLPLVYGIEGLIDEVMIYDRALTAEEIQKSFQAFCPPAEELPRPDLERRILPGGVDGSTAGKFGATCRTAKFHDLWDNLWRPGAYRDIVVRFDTVPGSVVFWQGTGFGSGWVTENNKWMSDQSWEIGGPHGCAEHMADKRGRFDHVRLIESTDARVVVHWRYAAIDVGYVFPGMNVWADEYYTIYPDGVGVRLVDGHRRGWQDTQFLSQPGTTCLDNLELTALSIANLRGQSADLTWVPPNRVPSNPLKDACIKRLNFKSKWRVFAIYQEGAELETWGASEQSKHTPDPFAGPWNHWPVGLNPSDGRYAVSHDRVTHAALGGAKNEGDFILYGFTDQPVTNLVPLAKSWHHPAPATGATGCEVKQYDQSQRAYVMSATGPTISFMLQGSTETPVFNPCFVIEHWDSNAVARVSINGRPVQPGRTFRQGIVRDASGRQTMVLWLELESASVIQVGISSG